LVGAEFDRCNLTRYNKCCNRTDPNNLNQKKWPVAGPPSDIIMILLLLTANQTYQGSSPYSKQLQSHAQIFLGNLYIHKLLTLL
jgi:hypothetical protein